MKTLLPSRLRVNQGFSLIELLVVIAVIAIVAGLAIPILSHINANARAVKDKENARNVVVVANSALATGAMVPTASAAALINALQAGIPTSDPFSNTVFKIDLTNAEEASAAALIKIENGIIEYDPGS